MNNIDNYRRISLRSHLYKLLTRIITNRLETRPISPNKTRQLPRRFQHDGPPTNKLNSQLTEDNIPIHFTFVEVQKAFETIEVIHFNISHNQWISLKQLTYNDITKTIDKILDSYFFQQKEEFFQQLDGCAMTAPICSRSYRQLQKFCKTVSNRI